MTTVRTVGHEVRAAELGPGISRTLRLANPARTVAVYWRSTRGAQVGPVAERRRGELRPRGGCGTVGVSPSGDDAAGNGVTGAHTSGWNSGSVGIALLGTLTNRDATPAARSALTDMLAWEAAKNGLDPMAVSPYVNPVSGASVTVPTIAGHRDYASTECPGETLYATLPALRSAVAARVSGGTGSTPDTTPPTVQGSVTAIAGTRLVTLAWAASTDATGVTGYTVSRSTKSATSGFGTRGSTATTGYTDTGLKTGRRYYYRVQASDAAGNRSAWSPVVAAVAR